jgi:Beta-lactamase enzyme family
MSFSDVISQLETLTGVFGVIAQTPHSEYMLNHRSAEYFPLASTAKVALGVYIASLVENGELSWNLTIKGLTLNQKEDSNVIYPHLQHVPELPLRHVVEIMIACHDHHCANAVADMLGGWDTANKLISNKFPGIKINQNARDEENNVGQLDALLGVFQYVIDGYRANRKQFEPVIAGLVRMADKTQGIPPQHQWNMTGGLPNALLNVGVLGNPMSGSYLMYIVAGRDLENRELTQDADNLTSDFIRTLYGIWENGPKEDALLHKNPL